jgi:hemin uptake protein HemP
MRADPPLSGSAPRDSAPPGTLSNAPESAVPIVVRSEALLRGQREILIVHSDDVYRLRITRNGKLILTK